MVILLGLAGGVIVVAGLRSASGIVAPLILALVITITVQPLDHLRSGLDLSGLNGVVTACRSLVLGPGPLGALLAVPMSLLVRAVFLDADPDSNWLRPLVANRPDDPPGSEPGRHEAEVTGASD